MVKIIRTVQGSGNGGHIYLPKEMIGKQVLVVQITKTLEDIKKEVLEILNPYLEHVLGVYLYGSYARGEQTPESDIDVWVISDKKLNIKNTENYEIITSTIEETKKTLKKNAVVVLSIIKEAIPLINRDLLKTLSSYNLNKKNTKQFVEHTESSLKIVEALMKDELKSSVPNITYPLMMRLRGLYLIKCLKENKIYSNKGLKEYLKLEDGIFEELYTIYQAVRDKRRIPPPKVKYKDLKKLYDITKKLLIEVKSYW